MPLLVKPSAAASRNCRPHAALTTLALSLVALCPAQAQTWTGTGLSNGWIDALNWQALARPVPSTTTAITFAGSIRLTPVQNLASPFVLNSLTFASGAGAFSLSGNPLQFDGTEAQVVQSSVNQAMIQNEVRVASNLTFSGSGLLTLTGGLTRVATADRNTLYVKKLGSGTLDLAAANSFDASLTIAGGRVLARDALALGKANVLILVDNGLSFGGLAQATLGGLWGTGALALGSTQLTLDGSDALGVYTGSISGSAGVVKNGSNTARWSGTSTFGTLQLNAGRVQLEGGSLTLSNSTQGLKVGSGSPSTGSATTLAVLNGAKASALGGTVEVDGVAGTALSISGFGSKLSTGFQTLIGNHGNGTVAVSDGGTLSAQTYLLVGWDNAGNGLLQVNPGGTVSSVAGVVGGLTGSNGVVDVNGAGAQWSTGSLGIGGFSNGQRGGTGRVTVRDGGVVKVSDRLEFWSSNATVNVNGGSLQAGGLASLDAFGTVALLADPTGGAALTLTGSGDTTFAGVLSGPGTLLKTGSGAQTLAGATGNVFTGQTIIRGGRIVVGHQDALRGSQVRIEVANGLDVNGLPNVVVGSLAGTGALALGTTQFTLGEDNRNASFGGLLTGSGATLVKKGTGTQALTATGSSLNRLVVEGGGSVSLQGGSLALSSGSNGLAAVQLNAGGRVEVLNGAQLTANGADLPSIFLSGDATTELLVDGSGSTVSSGFQVIAGITQQGRITVRHGGALQSNVYLGPGFYADSQGVISFESGAQGAAPYVGAGIMPGGAGRLLVSGAGTQLLATQALGLGGLSTAQSGGTGTLEISDSAVLSTPLLRFWTAASSLRNDGGSLIVGGLQSDAGGQLSLTADPAGGRALTLGANAGSFSFSGDIDGDGSLLKTGASTQVLSGRNRFTGAVQVQGGTLEMATGAAAEYEVGPGATLRLGESNLGFAVVQSAGGGRVVYTNSTVSGGQLLGPGSHDISAVRRMVGTHVGGGVVLTPASGTTFVGVVSDGTVNLSAGRSLTWTGGSNPTGTFNVAGSASVSNWRSGGVVQVAAGGRLLSTAGDMVMSGGSRTLVGAAGAPGGTIELGGGGRLQVNGGLLVNNGRILGPVELNYGSLAKGAGEYGQVIVNDGGRFSPGNSPGLVTTADATWGAGGGLLVELASADGTAGVDWDLWRVHGALLMQAGSTANSRFTVSLATLGAASQAASLAGFDASRAWQWLIVDTDDGVFGFNPASLALDTQGFLSPLAGGTLSLAVQGGDLYLQFAPVPEPRDWALWLSGLGVLSWAARRRQRG